MFTQSRAGIILDKREFLKPTRVDKLTLVELDRCVNMMDKNLRVFIDALKKTSKSSVVLVEGKRDKYALEYVGVKNVFTIGGLRLTDLPDVLEGYSHVVLLFDLDKHGERLTQKVRNILSREGYILIEEFRKKLRDIGITHMEELHERVRSSGQRSTAG